MAGIYYRFQLVGSKDPLAKSKAFLTELESAATKHVINTANLMVTQDMASAINTWNHKSSIHFDAKMRLSGSSITVSIFTDDAIFNYIEGGTKVRYATMTREPRFVAKTSPGSLSSISGAGGLHYVDKRVPRPGIEAREFYRVSAEKRRAFFIAKMRKIYIKALKNFGLR